MHSLIIALALFNSVFFNGHTHHVYAAPWAGHNQIFDVIDDGLPIFVSHTSGNASDPVALACNGRLFALWLDTTATLDNNCALYAAEWDGEFWNSAPLPSAYGIDLNVICTRSGPLAHYHDNLERSWWQVWSETGWSLPLDGEPAWQAPLTPRSFVALVMLPAERQIAHR